MHAQRMRQSKFRRNPALETHLTRLNGILAPAENIAIRPFDGPRLPMLLIIGAPRSGTTLLLQWLADSGLFSYPSNFISRFYHAPYLGAMVQRMMTDPSLAFRQEHLLPIATGTGEFLSELGKTSGLFAPNEFWYFWRRFFKYGTTQRLVPRAFRAACTRTLNRELAAFESVLSKPLLMKGMMFNWNLPEFHAAFPKTVLLHIHRDPPSNMASLLRARCQYFGNTRQWYSFKPPEFHQLARHTPHHQVAGQVYYTNKAIREGLLHIPKNKQLTISYESMCRDPRAVLDSIAALCSLPGQPLRACRMRLQPFACSRLADGARRRCLESAYVRLAQDRES